MIVEPIRSLTQLTQLFATGNASGDRVYSTCLIMNWKLQTEQNAIALLFWASEIDLRNVRFAYSENSVVSKMTRTLPAGKVTALVGHTGAGKSTISSLILRYYDCTEGCVRINGVDATCDCRTYGQISAWFRRTPFFLMLQSERT